MGFDIHGVFQKKEGDRWVDISSEYNEDRDLYLYWWLSSTRTAGLKPLSQPRGFPDDFEVDEYNFHPISSHDIRSPIKRKHANSYADRNKLGMGEWGFSWLLGSEIIAAPPPIESMTIWVPIDTYKAWDKVSNPALWHELHNDWQQHEEAELYATPENITDETLRVIVEWTYDFTSDFRYFVNEVRRLIALHTEVRFVFGFNA